MEKAISTNHRSLSGLRAHRPVFFFFLFAFFLLVSGAARAQTQEIAPVIVVSWKSPTLIPSAYSVKAMPVYNSRISVSADLFWDGSFMDPDLLFYTWSFNGSGLASGKGLRKVAFTVKTGPRTSNWIKAKIDYPGGKVEKTVFIPTAEPRVVVMQQRPYNILKEGVNRFSAHPFFFTAQSVPSLTFDWLFRGAPISNESAPLNTFSLEILPGTTSGTVLPVEVTVKNPANILESVSQNLLLTVQ